jgi:hypothetical protein
MPLQSTSGAASYDAFGGGAAAVPTFVEDVFSCFLYTANTPSTQTITNGIDLATYGGMVWTKSRDSTYNHCLMDSARGNSSGNILYSNLSVAAQTAPNAGISSYNSNGFSLRYDDGYGTNAPADSKIVSWTFRKQPKFFDVVTYTGNGTAGRTVAHSLGSVPGCIIVKRTNAANGWAVYHRAMDVSAPQDWMMRLNSTDARFDLTPSRWNDTAPTSTVFTLSGNDEVNGSGDTYVAYLFAHNAGGFGLTGTDNVISCGSFTTDGSGDATVSLGYEPQLVLMKYSSQSSDWMILDNMRGFRVTGNSSPGNSGLFPNLSNAESTSNGTISTYVDPNATGFTPIGFGPSKTVIYIAIRRGPMKVPTSGTSVYDAEAFTGTGATRAITTLSAPDMAWIRAYKDFTNSNTIQVYDRLRGNGVRLRTGLTNADNTNAAFLQFNNQMLATVGNDGETNGSGALNVAWAFKRAPGFFDEVCYTGTGTAGGMQTHNLGAVPEMYIVKSRSASATNWGVYHAANVAVSRYVYLNSNFTDTTSYTNFTAPTTTQFQVGGYAPLGGTSNSNNSGSTYVAYLFATLAGVSKVGSYTGTGTTLQIDCGFTGGARFVLIKRTDSTGDWYVWDSARGIVAGNDPYLLLNAGTGEVTNTDYVDTYSAGFEISSTAPAAINASGGSFIFLAIA